MAVASILLSLATTTLATGTSSSLWYSPGAQHLKRTTCEDVHIIIARGWMEPYPGRQGVLVDAICAGQSSSACGYEDIIYDNSATSVYSTAVGQGAEAALSQVANYAEDCPDAQIVLSGYSEGAHVFGDALAGGGGDFFGTVEETITGFASDTTSPGSHIAAVLLFGDPRHTASQSYNVISGASANGYYPRSGTNLDNLNVFSSVLRSYCLSGDEVCAGGDDSNAHTSYFEDSLGLVADAASWVRSAVGISGTATTTATLAADAPATVGTTAASSSSSSSSTSSASSSSKSSSSSSGSKTSTTTSASSSLVTATGTVSNETTTASSTGSTVASLIASSTSTSTAGSSSAPLASSSGSGVNVPNYARGLASTIILGVALLFV